jgi:virginiamycin B lyase
MSKRVFQLVITLFLALIVTTPLLMGCKATAVTPTAALPTSTAGPTGTLLPTGTPAAALPTNTARPTDTPPPTITATAPLPTKAATPTGAAPAARPAGQQAVVVFVQDGDIQVWDEATGQTETIFGSGDVIAVTTSDDGQVVAFLRRSAVKRSELDGYEQSALWAVERDGGNPRELVSAEALRELLNAGETDSANIPQMEWIPGTHRLLYTGWTYLVQAEGESHAIPRGLYLVDADSLADTVLLPAENSLRFALSPDGRQIALLSTTALGLIHVDGSNWRPDLFRYTAVGVPGRIIPSGVWTQDASAFLIAAPTESESDLVLSFTIWRVPVDGAPAQPLATITDSHSDSVTFSPDGRYAAFFRADSPGMVTHSSWFVTPLAPEAGPLAVPKSSYLSYKNLHWSPTGVPYAVHEGTMVQLCPDPAQDAEVCGEGFVLGDRIAEIHWIDGTRFLFVTREPYDLYFGRLDGTRILIAEGVERFSAVAMTCRNESEFTAGGAGPVDMSVARDTLFRMTWRIRNAGTCAWDPSYRLAFLAGERLWGPHSLPLGEAVSPGGEIELSVNLIAPAETGTYRGEWQLFAPDGRPFGVRPAVEIVVPSYAVTAFTPDQIVAEIPAGSGPIALGEGALWALGEQTVSRIDLDTNQVVATTPVGEFPQALAIGYGAVWATGLDGTVTRIDPLTNQVSGTIPVASSSGLNGVAAGAGAVWVSSGEQGMVYRIDPNTNQVIATIQVEPWSSQIATTQDAVWVTNPNNPILTRIDPGTNEVSAAIRLDCSTRELAADATAVWVACDGVPALLRIDPLTNQIVARIAVGNHPRGVAISSSGVWVASITDNTLTTIAPGTNQVIAVYQVGQGPVDVAAAEDEVWVAMSGNVWRIKP